MRKLTVKIFLVACISIVVLFNGNAIATDEFKEGKQSDMSIRTDAMPNITFLSREMSKSLKITPIPTLEPISLLVGTYWNCRVNAQDFEICRIKIVVCEDDQSFCVDVNNKGNNLQDITFLPREKRELLEITPIPTSEPIPLVVGTYWSCRINAQDFEICRIKIVVCEEDGPCTSVN